PPSLRPRRRRAADAGFRCKAALQAHNTVRYCGPLRESSLPVAAFYPHQGDNGSRSRTSQEPCAHRRAHWGGGGLSDGAGMIRLIGYFFGIGTALALLVA